MNGAMRHYLAAGLVAGILAPAAAVAQTTAPAPAAADWPAWQGPLRSGVTPEPSGYVSGTWHISKLWVASVGKGCSSPVIAGSTVYVMGWQKASNQQGGADTVYAYDAVSGSAVWTQSYPSRYQSRNKTGDEGQYGGPLSTPAYEAAKRRLYTLSVDGELQCWDTADRGKLVWKAELMQQFSVTRRPDVGKGTRDFGFTSSPLIHGDWVIVEVPPNVDGTVMAFDKATGRRAWASQTKEPAGHTSGPSVLTIDGKPHLAALTLRKLVVMRLDKGNEGKTLCETPWQTDYACNIASPACAGPDVLVTSGYNNSASILVRAGASPRQLWKSKGFATVGTPVIHKGLAFFPDGNLQCASLSDGQVKWRGPSMGHGSCLVTGDDKVIALGNGRLTLAEATGEKFQQLGSLDKVVPGTCYPHVALGGGVLACKDKDGNLAVYRVGKRP
jgi:hypothetical protein